MIDINKPETPVDVHLSPDGRLWVNVDGKCVLRISQATFEVTDERWFYYHHPESSSVFKIRGKLNDASKGGIEPIEEISREQYLELLHKYDQTDEDEYDPPEPFLNAPTDAERRELELRKKDETR